MTGPGAFWYTGGAEAQLLAATGFSGTAAFGVPQPAIAISGTITTSAVTGTAAFTVPQPLLAITGSVPVTTPPAVGGRPHGRKRAVVHRYPPRRPAPFDPADLTIADLHIGTVAFTVQLPVLAVRGDVVTPAERAADDRLVVTMAMEDDDVALALAVADTWL